MRDEVYRPLDGSDSGSAFQGKDDEESWAVVLPVPEGRGSYCPCDRRGKKADKVWRYCDPAGRLLGLVARWDLLPDGAERKRKRILPFAWCRDALGREEWRSKHFPVPRPLYRLDRLAARNDAPVLICEGEKSADAAALIFPDYVCVTSPGGCEAGHEADWTPLAGRSVTIWPDRKRPSGRKYAQTVTKILRGLRCDLALIDADAAASVAPNGTDRMPPDADQWDDAADALEEWPDREALRKAILQCAGPFSDVSDDEIDIEIEDEAEASAGKKSKWPPGFKMTPAGLKWTDPEKQSHVFVCGPIEVLAATCDPKNCGWGVLVRWKDPKGHVHERAVPKSILGGDGAELRKVLLDEGLSLGASLKSRNLLVQFLISVPADGFVRAVQSTGWHANVFVFPDGTIGDAAGEHTILQTDKFLDHNFNVRGTLEDWQQNVARFAVGNSRLVLSISMAFAAALIGPCGIESGGVHFVGPSSTGKTTTLIAAGSVWGGGDAGYVQTWRATSNGLEATAAAHNDALLCLDELAQVSSQEAGATAYMLANEKGKSRSTRELRARKAVKWRLLYLSSGEMSLADKIGEDGRGRKETAGQRVRVVEVPTDTGVHGLFENLHDVPDAAQFAKRLAGAAKTYYGAPARAFIAAVSGDLEKTNGFIRQGVQAFIDGRKLEGASGQVKRVCERFGIAAAAGELAINLGIVPWPKGEAIKAAAGCFQAWIDARGGIEAAEVTNGIAAVRAFLSAQGSSRFEAAWEEPPRDRDGNPVPPRIANQAGWRKRVILEDGEAWDYLISADAWREAAAGFNAESLARTLVERGYLLPGGDGKSSRNEKIPSHGQRRVYHISHTLLGGGADG